MRRRFIAFLVVSFLAPTLVGAQGAGGFKNFNRYAGLVPGVDLFAGDKQAATPFAQPLTDARQRLESLFGADLPKGAIFVCSSQQEADSVWEPRALKMGYGWVLTVLTPQAQMDAMIARLKAMMGEIPPERLERIRSRMAGQGAGALVAGVTRQMAYAITQVALAPEKPYRSSRLDDMARSPLPDWLDVGIAAYASGGNLGTGYLQQHMDETFALEDMLTMSRPFVAPASTGGGGGQFVMRQGSSGGAGQGANQGGGASDGPSAGPPQVFSMPAPGAQGSGGGGMSMGRGFGPRTLSKDQQDRMLFDSQATSFFAYFLQKAGLDKARELVALARQSKQPREYLGGSDLGSDFDKIEQEWTAWVKAQKPEPGEMRMERGGPPPQP